MSDTKLTVHAVIRDVTYSYENEPNEKRDSQIGYIVGGWQDGMEVTQLDNETYFFFDTLEELLEQRENYEISDEAIIDHIGDPVFITERYNKPDPIPCFADRLVTLKADGRTALVTQDRGNGELMLYDGQMIRDEDVNFESRIVPQKYRDEFQSLLNDDPNFNYAVGDFQGWVQEQVIPFLGQYRHIKKTISATRRDPFPYGIELIQDGVVIETLWYDYLPQRDEAYHKIKADPSPMFEIYTNKVPVGGRFMTENGGIENLEEGQWLVPYDEMKSSYKLAMDTAKIDPAIVGDIVQTVEDFMGNNFGDE